MASGRKLFFNRFVPSLPVDTLTRSYSGAELTSVILCTALPMMPRLVALMSERYSQYRSRHPIRRGKGTWAGILLEDNRCHSHGVGLRRDVRAQKRPDEIIEDDKQRLRGLRSSSNIETTTDIELAHQTL